MLPADQDAYGRELYDYWQKGEGIEIIERDDGFITAAKDLPARYFAPFEEWPEFEQKAMEYAQGRVLDVGSGAGRVPLYLQSQGYEVLAIDNSSLALEVCRQRGVEKTSPTPLKNVSKSLGKFDTIVMLGNNFGLLENRWQAKRLLRRFQSMTYPEARIIAESNDIYQTTEPAHLKYHQLNRNRGRLPGQIRLRVRHHQFSTPWFDYLMVCKEEMQDLLHGTGWCIHRFINQADGPLYIAIIEKG